MKKEEKIVNFFTQPYTIIFFLGCYLFIVLSNIVHGFIYPPEPSKGMTNIVTPDISVWGILFMISSGLFLFVLWFHTRYKITKK